MIFLSKARGQRRSGIMGPIGPYGSLWVPIWVLWVPMSNHFEQMEVL
jgi:hypothetical protein